MWLKRFAEFGRARSKACSNIGDQSSPHQQGVCGSAVAAGKESLIENSSHPFSYTLTWYQAIALRIINSFVSNVGAVCGHSFITVKAYIDLVVISFDIEYHLSNPFHAFIPGFAYGIACTSHPSSTSITFCIQLTCRRSVASTRVSTRNSSL